MLEKYNGTEELEREQIEWINIAKSERTTMSKEEKTNHWEKTQEKCICKWYNKNYNRKERIRATYE